MQDKTAESPTANKPTSQDEESVCSEEVPTEASNVNYAGHKASIVSVAKLCRDSGTFTDVNIVCKDGSIKAHRLVLASCSDLLKEVFLGLPQGLPEFTLIIPDLKKEIVEKLIEFLYTGKMVLSRKSTVDLQHLVHVLQIDPSNVRMEAIEDTKQTKYIQSKITSLLKANQSSKTNQSSSDQKQRGLAGEKKTSSSLTTPSKTILNAEKLTRKDKTPNTIVESKARPSKVMKRKLSGENVRSSSPKEKRGDSNAGASSSQNVSSSSSRRGEGGLRRRGGKMRSGHISRHRHSSSNSSTYSGKVGSSLTSSGYHDLMDIQTWVCAICNQYDPILPPDVDPNEAANTEWIGCDCNRWYHQYCTRLSTVDDSFNCSMVKLQCLPMTGDDSS